MTGITAIDHGWWLASRSAGIVAYLLLSASIVLGLVMATRLAAPRFRPALRLAHERISLIALGALAAHALFLLADRWLQPGVSGILVPFTLSYRPLWTGLGVCAGYVSVALSLSYYLRRQIGARSWRSAHRYIPIAWALATAHVLGAGSDAGAVWMKAALFATIGSVGVLLAYRVLKSRFDTPADPPARPRSAARDRVAA